MKLLIREYLSSLKERGELDSILPDLLSEAGFHVYSRPQRGTRQYGVDVGAYGRDDDGEEKVFLFSVKSGDLRRTDWDDGSPQSLRASLNEIRDAYIPMRIPNEYSDRKIVICICFGGEMHEQVQDSVRGYIRDNEKERISYQEWNGDRLANFILSGILREDILPKKDRSSFQKAIAMVDTPDVSYRYFAGLIGQLVKRHGESENSRLTACRQVNICLWILFVWARDTNNIEAPYRASELAILQVWELCRPQVGQKTKHSEALVRVLQQVIELHILISFQFLEEKILPHTGKIDAIATAIASHNSVDINQKLFDLIGRIAMAGMWVRCLGQKGDDVGREAAQQQLARLSTCAFQLIESNSALFLPLRDIDSIEVSMLLLLAAMAGGNENKIHKWLKQMALRLDYTLRTHGKYTCVFTEYKMLIEHPREQTEEYRKEATAGSTLVPLLVAWLGAMGEQEAVNLLVKLKQTILSDCTLQFWLPDTGSDDLLYVGDHDHGTALTDLSIDLPFEKYMSMIARACERKSTFNSLSAVANGLWPIVLLACRHHRFPVPPQFWLPILQTSSMSSAQNEHGD